MRFWRRRPRPEPNRPIAVYAWYDDQDCPLYVGMSNSLSDRAHAHFWQALWIHDAATMRILSWHRTRMDARAAEKRAIRTLRPHHNVKHKPTSAVRTKTPAAVPPSPPASLTRDEAMDSFVRMLEAEIGTELRIADMLRRWPHRSRPWVHTELARLVDAGVVDRLPPEVPFGPARYRPKGGRGKENRTQDAHG